MNLSYENIVLVSKRSFQLSAVLVLTMVLFFGALLFYEKKKEYEGDKALVDEIYHRLYEEKLLADLTFESNLIDRLRKDTRRKMELHLVEESKQVMERVKMRYDQSPDTTIMGRERAILEELRRLNDDTTSRKIFVFQKSDGKILLYPRNDSLEGKNIITDFSATQQKEFLSLLQAMGKGGNQPLAFTPLSFTNDAPLFPPTLSYVNNYDLLGWIIGVDDLYAFNERQVQERVRQSLEEIDGEGKIGLYELPTSSAQLDEARLIVSCGMASLGTTLSMLFEDELQQQHLASLKSSIRTTKQYVYRTPQTDTSVGKISVFLAYPEWNWILTRTITLEKLDEEMVKIEGARYAELRSTFLHVAVILLGTALLFLLIAYRQSKQLRWLVAGLLEQKSSYVEELKIENRALDEKSLTDQLTHLHNRESFDKQLDVEIARCARYGHSLSLIMLDLDNFKRINDTFGHLFGDKALQVVSEKIAEHIRRVDYLYRWGGDEFTIIVPETTLEEAWQLAEKLRKIVADIELPGAIQISGSFGVANFCEGDTADILFSRADNQLIEAKKEGKNRVSPSM